MDPQDDWRDAGTPERRGGELFDREPPPDYGVGWADALVRLRPDSRERPVLVFRMGAELLALPLRVLAAVSEWRPIRTVPHGPDECLLGIVSIAGELQLCVSLETLFELPRPGADDRPPTARFLVLGEDRVEWVVPVDEAVTVQEVVLDTLAAVPATLQRSSGRFVQGLFEWRDHQVGVLDGDLVLASLRRRFS